MKSSMFVLEGVERRAWATAEGAVSAAAATGIRSARGVCPGSTLRAKLRLVPIGPLKVILGPLQLSRVRDLCLPKPSSVELSHSVEMVAHG